MSRVIFFLAACGLLGLLACIPLSINPYYGEKDLTFNSALLGTWSEEDGKSEYSFEQSGPNAYTMLYKEDGQESKFEAHLFKLGEKLFLDLYPLDPGVKIPDAFQDHMLMVHSFYRVNQIEPDLMMSTFDINWLKEELTKNPKALSHLFLDDRQSDSLTIKNDRIVLTASTPELQAFIVRNLDTKGAFTDPEKMHRVENR
jgi:hypothetical protein